MEELNEVSIDLDHPDHKVYIGSRLSVDIRKQLIEFLKERHNSFAWSYEDMDGIDLEIMVHRLQVDPDHQQLNRKEESSLPRGTR